jgi:hypothetical protein
LQKEQELSLWPHEAAQRAIGWRPRRLVGVELVEPPQPPQPAQSAQPPQPVELVRRYR